MKLMFSLLFLASWFSVFAQITISNDGFPSVGDTVWVATDTLGAGIVMGPNGGPATWDFTGLQAHRQTQSVYRSPSEGTGSAEFPNADVLLISPSGAETYYNKSASAWSILGFLGGQGGGGGLGVNQAVRALPPLVMRRAPMSFFDVNQTESDFTLAISLAAIPDSIIPGLPGIDSIRFRVNTRRLDVVDGYGEVKLKDGNYPVLRQKQTEYTDTKIDIRTFLGWTAIPGIGGFQGGTDTTIRYVFFSNTPKEPVATVSYNANGTYDNATFLNKPATSSVKNTATTKANSTAKMSAFPNPAFEEVYIDCKNLPRSMYTLKVFNLVGNTIYKETKEINGNHKFYIDLENFTKGTYFYSLTNKEGQTIGTKRLAVIKP